MNAVILAARMSNLNTMWVLFFACVVLLAMIYLVSQIHPGCGWALSLAIPFVFLLCMRDGEVFSESLSSRWQERAFLLACAVMMAGIVLSQIPYQIGLYDERLKIDKKLAEEKKKSEIEKSDE